VEGRSKDTGPTAAESSQKREYVEGLARERKTSKEKPYGREPAEFGKNRKQKRTSQGGTKGGDGPASKNSEVMGECQKIRSKKETAEQKKKESESGWGK